MGRKWTDSSVETGTSVAAGDLILTVSDPSGTPVSKKITVQNLMDSDSVREAIRDHLGDAVISGGANVTVTHDDAANTITVAVTSLDNAPVGATTPSTGSFTVNTVDQLVFDITAAIESDTAGEMSWDEDAETVMLALDSQIHMHIGQDSFYHAINQTGSDIAKGTAVYAVGTVGNSGKIQIAPFTADGTYNSKYFMGVTAEAITNGSTGFVVHFGKIRQLDTSVWNEGDILYADPSTAGGLTSTQPAAPNNIITVAIVVTKSATVGELFIRPTFVDGFDDSEDVTITSATTGDVLRYNGTVWVNYADSNYASATGLSTHIADTSNPHSVTATQVGLGNVENTALSTWAGSTNLTTLGTITTGTWNGDTIASAYIGSHTHAASDVTSGTFADARIAQTNVTQHQAALSITESQISDFGSYQPLDSGLTSIAGLTTVADKMLYTTASDTYATATLTSFARSILDDADAATVRTTIGVDAAGTDNSTDVTLAGTYDYLTLSGQQITLGQIDLSTDVTGTLPSGNIGSHTHTSADITDFQEAVEDDVANLLTAGSGISLSYNDVSGVLTITNTGSAISSLDDISDVTITSATTGDLLRWSGSAWVNYADSNYAAASHTHTASNITDFSEAVDDRVDALLTAGTDISLTYNDVANTLTIAYTGASGGSTALTGLTDVTITSATTGDLLRYNGTIWVNYADSNYAAASHTHAASDITSGTFADARIAESNVTQHQAALSITESQISDLGTYQTQDAGLTSIAGLTTAADKMLYTTASDTYAVTDLTSFARSILDDADAAAVRTTIGVDAAGTDNSTNVTLAGTYDYLTIAGQVITLGQIDLTTDVTGTLPIANGGTGATTAAAARTALDVDQAGTDNSTNVTLATVAGNYLTIVGQEITAGTVPVSLGGTGATTAAGARTALDVDQAGTDNSTNVTIAAGLDYITISGQQLTLGSVDLTTDVTGTLPIANGGTGATTAAAARTALDVDQAGTDNSTNVTLAGTYDYLTLSGQQITLGQIDLTTDVTGVLPSGNIGSHTHTASDVTDFSTAADARIALAVLDDLADVVETTITTGDLLRWNGTNWVNYADSNYSPSSGSTSITTLGTIGTGVWQGTAIDSAYIDPTLSVTSVTAGTLTLASGSITDSSGAISFGNENLSTTGTLGVTGGGRFGGSALTASATYDDLVIETTGNTGISILTNSTTGDAGLMLGAQSNTTGAMFRYNETSANAVLATRISGHSLVLRSGANTTALTLDSSQNATFAGNVTLSAGSLSVTDTATRIVEIVQSQSNINAELFFADGVGDRYRVGTTASGADFRIRDEQNARSVMEYDASANLRTFAGEVNLQDNLLTRPIVKDYAMEVNALGNITTTATINLENGNVHTATVTGAVTLTFSNPIASGDATSFTLELTNGGSSTVTFPAAVDWEGGTAPTLTAAGVDILVFYTRDGGTTWHGIVSSLDSK